MLKTPYNDWRKGPKTYIVRLLLLQNQFKLVTDRYKLNEPAVCSIVTERSHSKHSMQN